MKRVLIRNEKSRTYLEAADLWTGDATRALDFQTEERATTFLKKRNLAEKCSIVELESTETQIFRRNLNRISDPPVRSRQK